MGDCKHEDDTYYESIVDSDYTDVESPSELPGWNEDEEVLECTRSAQDGDFCVFHQELDVENREEVREKLEEGMKESSDRPLIVTDANLCRIILDGIEVNRPVWLIGVHFDNRFAMDEVTFNHDFIVRDSEFDDFVDFENVNLEGNSSFRNAEFNARSEFRLTKFDKECDFSSADFNSTVVFDRDKFEDDSEFKYTDFYEETRFASCRFRGGASFVGATFNSETKMARLRDIDGIDGANAAKTRFDGRADFREVKFKENARLNISFNSRANFRQATLTNCDFTDVDLTQADLEDANLDESILYNADLRGAKLMGAKLQNTRINSKTVFLGNPEDDVVDGYNHSVTSIVKNERCYYDPKAEYRGEDDLSDEELRTRARIVYRELQDLGNSASHSQLQTRAFVRRKDMEKNLHWKDIWSTEDGITQPIVAGSRWASSRISRAVMLYGESPWRVLGWSAISIIGFALTFILFGLIEGPNGVVQVGLLDIVQNPQEFFGALASSIYYSALIFTNLSFGRYDPVGVGTYLTALETLIGLTMLALFFFVLGRRASK